jgi:ElaB/YqjD/DUF883 family membrane-anchored ribosome-binding protein
MANGPDDIRDQVDERDADEREPEAIREENRVQGTVEGVQEAVTDTVDSVKEAVQETWHSVKRAVDLPYQTERRPWLMFGLSVAAGYVVGSLIEAMGERGRTSRGPTSRARGGYDGTGVAPRTRVAEEPARFVGDGRPSGGLIAGVLDQFSGELRTLRSAAIGMLVGVVRDMLKRAVPAMAPHLDKALNSVATKLGGEPIPGPVLESGTNQHHEGTETPRAGQTQASPVAG